MPGPIPVRAAPTQTVQQRRLIDSLRGAGLSDAAANDVANQNTTGLFDGYVASITTENRQDTSQPGAFKEYFWTGVFVDGEWLGEPPPGQGYAGLRETIFLNFPPNNPMYLPELRRAQTTPHLQVRILIGSNVGYLGGGAAGEILQLTVGLDYNRLMHSTPPFDERVIIDRTERLVP